MNDNSFNSEHSQKFGDRYGYGQPVNVPQEKPALGSSLGNKTNNNPFSNPYEGKKVLMEGEEAFAINEHNVYAKSQNAKVDLNKNDFSSEGKKDLTKIKIITAISIVGLIIVIGAVIVAFFVK